MEPYRLATPADLSALLALQRAYYAEAEYPFDAARMRAAMEPLLGDASLGAIWLAEEDGAPVAYAVLTLGWSLEHGGRDAFVDELYVAPGSRRRGLGRSGLRTIEAECRARGVRALHLEVERALAGARELYRRAGFADRAQLLMTRPLS